MGRSRFVDLWENPLPLPPSHTAHAHKYVPPLPTLWITMGIAPPPKIWRHITMWDGSGGGGLELGHIKMYVFFHFDIKHLNFLLATVSGSNVKQVTSLKSQSKKSL